MGGTAAGGDATLTEPPVVSDRVVTIPNALSVLRLFGVPLFLWLILGPHADGWAIVVLVVGGLTDYLDGIIARRFNQTSRLGQLLDPAADRLYILATVVGLAGRGIIPVWLALALPLRDLLLAPTIPLLRRHGLAPLQVHFLGKAATFNLLYAFPLLLLSAGTGAVSTAVYPLAWAFTIWGVGLYWWSGLLYAEQVRRAIRS